MADRLRERVADTRTRPQTTGGGQLAAREDASALVPAGQADSVAAILTKVRKMEPAFAQAAPRGEEAVRLIRDAVTAIRRNPELAKCTHDTVLGGLMTFAQLGLRVGVLGHGWLLPIYNSRRRVFEAQVIVGYKGYVSLAYRGSDIRGVSARTIQAEDYYRIEYGTDHDGIVHRPPENGAADRGAPVGYYSVVKHGREGRTWFYMSHPEMEAWRDLHAMAKLREKGTGRVRERPDGGPLIVGPWVDDFQSMAWKTVFLRCVPWIPMSESLEYAVAADEGVRADYSNPENHDGMLSTERVNDDGDDDEGAEPEPVRGRVVIDQRDADDADGRRDAAGRTAEPADEPAEPPADEPARPAGSKPALPVQVRDIMSLMSEGKVTDPAVVAEITAWLVKIDSPIAPNNLTRVQASAVLDRLKALKRDDELVATLAEAATAGAQQPDGDASTDTSTE